MNNIQESISNLVRYSFRNTMYECVWGDAVSAFHISTYNSINDLLDSLMFESVCDLIYDSVRREYE